jgi:hypothetical protein
MSDTELGPGQAMPIEAPEIAAAQLPLDEARIEITELDSDKLNLLELGAQLETVAQRVTKKSDGITAQTQLAVSHSLIPVAILVGGESALVGSVFSDSPNVASVGMFIGIVGAATGKAIADKKATGKVAPIQIPEGYSIQCLRANKTSLAFDAREAVAFVHPRKYEDDERQTTDQARDRLRDALTVIEAAPTVTKVVLPASALREAQLPHRSSKSYNETVLDMKLDAGVNGQYKDSEMSVVLTGKAAKRLAEALQHAQKHPLLHTVDALAERFPSVRLQLAEAADDNELLVPLLHTLLRRTLDGELPGAQRERGHDGLTYYDRVAPLLTQTDTANKFDPLITQRQAANYAPVETKRLSQMTGDDEQLMADILDRLELRGYNDLQLVSVALRLAEHRHKERAAEPPADTQITETDLLVGADPTAIYINSESHPARSRLMWRSLGRIAAAGLAGSFMAQGVAIGINMLDIHLPKPPGVINEADVTWRVDEHGMTSVGYYTQVAYDHFDASTMQWDGKEGFKWVEPLPTALKDTNQEHLTISGITNSPDVDLPIRHGTLLSAISAQTEKGQEIKLSVHIRGDSTRTVHVENAGTPYKLSYELTPDAHRKRAPFADRALKVTDPSWNDLNPSSFPHDRKPSAYSTANYISDNFTYDASTSLRDQLSSKHTANDYLRTVYDGGRCDCIECATAAALLTESIQPGQTLLLGTGYLNNAAPENGHSYLKSSEAHAWLIDTNGFITDATAKKIDKNSNVPIHKTVAESDAQMKDGGWSTASKVADDTATKAATAANQDKHSPWRGLEGIALTGLGTLAAAGIWREARKRTITNAALTLMRSGQWLTSAAMVRPGKAVSAMAWHAYGSDKTPMPAYETEQRIFLTDNISKAVAEQRMPSVENISTDVLQEIARGALRLDPQLTRHERRGIQRMAKLLLAERRRDEKPAPHE